MPIVNIFASSKCPIESAQALANIHIVKMCVEQMQLLSTAHVEVDGNQIAYKASHKNHPSSKWTRESKANYHWAWMHAKALCDEYEYRTGKIHACAQYLDVLKNPPKGIVKEELTGFACVVPDDIKIKCISMNGLDVHKAYRYYLSKKYAEWATRVDKRPIVATWTNRNKPEWLV